MFENYQIETLTVTGPELCGLLNDLLALLALIDLNEDAAIASQRFEILEKHGFKVEFSHEVSGATN